MHNSVELSYHFIKTLHSQKVKKIQREPWDKKGVEEAVAALKSVDLKQLATDDQKKAFWLNVYNGICCYFRLKKMFSKVGLYNRILFRHKKIQVGNYFWTLDSIEHGLLRQNRKPPLSPCRTLRKKVEKEAMQVKVFDPRIHFALSAGMIDSPMLRYYQTESIEQDLKEAQRLFVGNNFIYDIEFRRMALSVLFKVYKKDFEGKFLDNKEFEGFKKKWIPFRFYPELKVPQRGNATK